MANNGEKAHRILQGWKHEPFRTAHQGCGQYRRRRRLGKVMDIEFDARDGRVEAIVVPGEWKVGSLIRGEKCGIVIPWHRICKIGEHVNLVQLEPGDLLED